MSSIKKLGVAIIVACCCTITLQSVPVQPSEPPVKLPEPKKLICREMALLNDVLAASPLGIVRIDIACKLAHKVLNNLATISNDPKLISEQMTLIMSPVKQFFDTIHSYAAIVKPLIVESVGKTSVDQKPSLLLNFLDDKSSMENYFETTVKTKEDLQRTCIEFITLFGDLRKSLSDRVIQAYRGIVEDIKKTQQKASASTIAATA